MKLTISALTLVLALGAVHDAQAECDKVTCKKAFSKCLKKGSKRFCDAGILDKACLDCGDKCGQLEKYGSDCSNTKNEKMKAGCLWLNDYYGCSGGGGGDCTEDCPGENVRIQKDAKVDVNDLDLTIDTDIMSVEEYDYLSREGKLGEWVKDEKLDAYVFRRKLSSARLELGNQGIRGLGDKTIEAVALNKDTIGSIDSTVAEAGIWLKHLKMMSQVEFKESIKQEDIKDGEDWATNVYGTDDRYVYRDTSYPWSTVGRVGTTSGGACTGTMVGRNLLLTGGHCMQWNDDGTIGSFSFTPAFFNGDAPFGTAWATRVYYWMQAEGPGLSDLESAYDYVVAVLNTNIGDSTGYAGYRVYNPSWNGGNYWQNTGYPGGLTAAQRPAFSEGGSIDTVEVEDIADAPEAAVLGNRIDMEPGHSGGAYWGWWEDENFPRIVGVCSAEAGTPTSSGTLGDNDAGGGQALWDLISYVRTNEPDSTF